MPEVETKKEATKGTASGKAGFWLDEIERAKKRERDWRKEGKEIVERYRNERKRKRSLNILWANTELLKPTVLSRTPQPDVRQRFMVEDPIAREAAEILEKALKFTADDPDYGFVENLEAARDDMLLPGRGVARVIYERDIKRQTLHEVTTGSNGSTKTTYSMQGVMGEVEPDGVDDEGNPYRESIGRQEVYCKHIYWEDYLEGDARCWDDVPWVAYRHTMTRATLKKQFGEIGSIVPLTLGHKDSEDKKDDPEHPLNRAAVWEIWDKEEKTRVWVAESYRDDVLDEEDNPLGLEGFFPQPDPIYSIRTTDKRIAVPEFRIYKDQADELDEISLRIKRLIEALKVRGVYAAVMKEVADLLNGDENELFPVEDWAALKDRGGLDGAIAWLPIEQISKVLVSLYKQRLELKNEIYELTGISDLLRGSTDAGETATAQRLKGNFGTMRLTPRQQPMERFARGLFRIKAEIVAEHFTAEHLMKMTGQEVPPEVIALLRDQKLRSFTIDIETDSTVQPDEQKEQANVIEFMDVSTKFLESAATAAAAAPQLTPMLFEMFKAGARRFKMGRELEDVIEQTAQEVSRQAQQQQQPQPDPKAEAEAAKAEAIKQKAVLDMQTGQTKHQMDMTRMAAEGQRDMQKLAIDKERLAMQGAN